MNELEVDDIVSKIRRVWPAFPCEEVDVYRVSLGQHDFNTVRTVLNGLDGPTPYDVLALQLPPVFQPLTPQQREAGLAHINRIRAEHGWNHKETTP